MNGYAVRGGAWRPAGQLGLPTGPDQPTPGMQAPPRISFATTARSAEQCDAIQREIARVQRIAAGSRVALDFDAPGRPPLRAAAPFGPGNPRSLAARFETLGDRAPLPTCDDWRAWTADRRAAYVESALREALFASTRTNLREYDPASVAVVVAWQLARVDTACATRRAALDAELARLRRRYDDCLGGAAGYGPGTVQPHKTEAFEITTAVEPPDVGRYPAPKSAKGLADAARAVALPVALGAVAGAAVAILYARHRRRRR